MAKQEMARVNIDILRISELKWTGMGECNSDDHLLLWAKSFRRNGVVLIVNKRVQNAVLGCISQKQQNYFCSYPSKPFNIKSTMPRPVMLKKLKLNGSTKIYKTF